MLVEDLLNLARVHVVATSDDHVLLAVAGVKPAVLDRLAGRGGALPIALHHVRAADHDLADLVHRTLVAMLVDDLHLHVLDRRSNRPRLALAIGIVKRSDRRCLGESIALEHLAVERTIEAAQYLDRKRRAARDADAQGGVVKGRSE